MGKRIISRRTLEMRFIHSKDKEQRQITVAVMTNTEGFARAKILKKFGIANTFLCGFSGIFGFGEPTDIEKALCIDKLKMKDKYSAVVKCQNGDIPDEQIGEQEARKKVLNNLKKAEQKAYKKWQVAMLKKIKEANPDTFANAVTEAYKDTGKVMFIVD